MPRVPRHLVDQRRDRLAQLLAGERYLPVSELARRLDVSEVTARRDLIALDKADRVRRTHGGAVSVERYDRHFASFDARRRCHAAAKAAIARRALPLAETDMCIFLDAGTTCHRLAEALRRQPPAGLRVLTQSLAVAELLAESAWVTLTGGRLLPRQRTLVGPAADRAVKSASIDVAFLGAEAFGPAGVANSQQDVVRLQREVIRRSGRHAWLLDASKLGLSAPHAVAGWDDLDLLVTDAAAAQLADLPLPVDRQLLTESSDRESSDHA